MDSIDKDLLEQAAKFAKVPLWFDDRGVPWYDGDKYVWDPLEDDAIVFDLIAKYKIDLMFDTDEVWASFEDRIHVEEPYGEDVKEATRRAVVRLLASLGEELCLN